MSGSKENFEHESGQPSKSQRRRDALETLSLADRLIKLSPARLNSVPLDDQVLREIESARKIRSHVARKRQMQYVAKLLRRDDEQPILDALEAMDNEARQLTARQHRSEAWRDALLQQGDDALGKLLQSRRDADGQAIRQLVRNARREIAAQRPPASARSLFRLLRDLDEKEPLPPLN